MSIRYRYRKSVDFTTCPTDIVDRELIQRLGEKWAASFRWYCLQEDVKQTNVGRSPLYAAAAALRKVFGNGTR